MDQQVIDPFHIPGEMAFIRVWQVRQVLPIGELFRQMEDSPEKIGEEFVFQQDGVFK